MTFILYLIFQTSTFTEVVSALDYKLTATVQWDYSLYFVDFMLFRWNKPFITSIDNSHASVSSICFCRSNWDDDDDDAEEWALYAGAAKSALARRDAFV